MKSNINNYKITEEGKVFKKGKEMKPYNNGLGYRAVKLVVNGVRKQFYVHRLVAEMFIGGVDGMVVNHIDGNKSNNNINNLEIVTQKQNQKHAFDNKLLKGFVSRYY